MQSRKIEVINKLEAAIAAAHNHEGILKPILTPIQTFLDTRSLSFMNILGGTLPSRGQINYSKIFPGAIKAWHKHHEQTDYWICVEGNLRVGIIERISKEDISWTAFIGENNPYMLIIPPSLWHGCSPIGDKPAGLLYCVSEAYNPNNPDEERLSLFEFDYNWNIQHG